MLSMKNISKSFATDNVVTHALRDINLDLGEGDFVSVTGPSGSGKTTFLNIAGLLESSTAGEYWLDGEDISKLDDKGRSRMRNQKIGFIFQSFNLIPDLNLFDNVDVPLRYRGFNASERKKRIEYHLDQVGLASRMKHLPSQLSGGQQQRVAIARALVGEPAILLADEPTGNLDSENAKSISALLTEFNSRGQSILLVTHDANVASIATRQLFMQNGRLTEATAWQAAS